MIEIGYPLIYIFLPIFIGIWYFLDYKKLGYNFPNKIIAKYCNRPFLLLGLWIIRIIIIFFLVSLLAEISFSYQITKHIQESKNIIIVLDISRSMLSEDIKPSRMNIAKKTIDHFIYNRKGDNIGMIIFAGKPFTVIANSSDNEGISYFLESLTPHFILQEKSGLSGTNIGDALLLAENSLQNVTGDKAIILITDGSANIGSNPIISAEYISKKNIPIYTIGIGTKNNNPLFYTDSSGQKTYFYDENGKEIIGDLDDTLLQKIADISKGKYFTAESILELENAFSYTNANIGNKFHKKKIMQKVALNPLILCLLITFLVGENFIRRKIYQQFLII